MLNEGNDLNLNNIVFQSIDGENDIDLDLESLLKKDLSNEKKGKNQEEENSNTNTNTENKTAPEDTCLGKIFTWLRNKDAWRPLPTIIYTVLCLEITGVIFLLLGILILVLSNKIQYLEIRYDNNPDCEIGKNCTIPLLIKEDMKKTVMVYYRMKNLYQNHRRYIKSKSYSQLKGKELKESQIKEDCDPIILNKDIYEGVKNLNGEKLPSEGVAHPCGLIARSFFNDSYIIKNKNKENIDISSKDIAWSLDKKKYKNSPNYKNTQWLDVEDERFIVWMRPAALPDFRKLWGKIENDLLKGDYELTIVNNYPVKSFEGEKYFVLSTVNLIGGRNYFLGIFYEVVAGVCIIAGILFIIGDKYYNDGKDKKD